MAEVLEHPALRSSFTGLNRNRVQNLFRRVVRVN